MTAKQKANALKFKKAIAEAKKLRAKNPKLTQPQAVKQAWAVLFKKNKIGDYNINNTQFNETRIPISPRKKRTKKKKTYAVLREYDGTFKKIKRISGVKPARKKATAKSYHKDTKSHNVKISVMSGVAKSDIDFWVKMFAPRPKKLQLEWYKNLVSSFKTGHFDIFTPKEKGEAQLRALEYILNKKPLNIK